MPPPTDRPAPPWIRTLRWFVAVVYIGYGGTKLLGGQFWHGPFTIDSESVDGPFLVWAFFGWSPAYSVFIGLGELVPGVLLLFNRTALLGALMLFPVALNITVLTFAFDFPAVKFVSLGYTALLAVLLGWDRDRLLPVLWPTPAPRAAPFSRLGRVLLAALGLPIVFIATTALAESLSSGPEAPVRELLVARGLPRDSLVLVRSRYHGQLFNRTGVVEYRTADSTRFFQAEVGRAISYLPWRVGTIRESPP
jgi:hypothetical protein